MMKPILALAFLAASTAVLAEVPWPPNGAGAEMLKQHCLESRGRYGPEVVLACIKDEAQALAEMLPWMQANKDHPAFREIVLRCHRSRGRYGYETMLACLRDDMTAQLALDQIK